MSALGPMAWQAIVTLLIAGSVLGAAGFAEWLARTRRRP